MGIANLYPSAANKPRFSFDVSIPAPDVDPDESDTVVMHINPAWIPPMLGALDQLLLYYTWNTDEPGKLLAVNRASNLKNIVGSATFAPVDTPYWDDATDIDDESPADDQVWYGQVEDPTVPPTSLTFIENALVWGFTGLLAVGSGGAGLAPAIFFHTIAPQFIIATKTGDFGKIIRIFVDGAQAAQVTDDGSGDILNIPVIADPDLETHQLYITLGDT